MAFEQTIRLKDYDVYGFDIDHTIAKYNIPHLFDVCIGFVYSVNIDAGQINRISKHFIDKITL